MALRLVSLLVAMPVTLVNVYWASGLDGSVSYIASLSDGRCSMVGWLWPLGSVLPWVFLALCIGSARQLIFRGRFGLSVDLLTLHVAHLSLLLLLLVVGNSPCVGAGLWQVVRNFLELLGSGVAVMLLPVPILALQVQAMRTDGQRKSSAL
ncbi:MAG: hypothetical protein JNN02_09380 [Tabrizicola sp.]|nr:hypothetical protein [Tabrizicola sp.]